MNTDCDFEASGTEEEVLQDAIDHLMVIHGMDEEDITPDMEAKILGAMQDSDMSIIEEAPTLASEDGQMSS